jgi:hypothetical protein
MLVNDGDGIQAVELQQCSRFRDRHLFLKRERVGRHEIRYNE